MLYHIYRTELYGLLRRMADRITTRRRIGNHLRRLGIRIFLLLVWKRKHSDLLPLWECPQLMVFPTSNSTFANRLRDLVTNSFLWGVHWMSKKLCCVITKRDFPHWPYCPLCYTSKGEPKWRQLRLESLKNNTSGSLRIAQTNSLGSWESKSMF